MKRFFLFIFFIVIIAIIFWIFLDAPHEEQLIGYLLHSTSLV